jgi:DMSO/TMAO reductase YedYZ molybdopterin-dependent catalytic subunit
LAQGSSAGKAQAQDAWDLTPTSFEDATSYNNFYEFGTDKADPGASRPSDDDGAVER